MMQYHNDPVDVMVDDIKSTAGVLAKLLFAGFNLVFIIVLGILIVSNLAM